MIPAAAARHRHPLQLRRRARDLHQPADHARARAQQRHGLRARAHGGL